MQKDSGSILTIYSCLSQAPARKRCVFARRSSGPTLWM
jgi:hypothetical protein